jgi:hypothetical protein
MSTGGRPDEIPILVHEGTFQRRDCMNKCVQDGLIEAQRVGVRSEGLDRRIDVHALSRPSHQAVEDITLRQTPARQPSRQHEHGIAGAGALDGRMHSARVYRVERSAAAAEDAERLAQPGTAHDGGLDSSLTSGL